MKKSKPTKSNDPAKILRMIARNEELERNDGKWIAMNRPYKNKKKYCRKNNKINLGKEESLGLFFHPSRKQANSLYIDRK